MKHASDGIYKDKTQRETDILFNKLHFKMNEAVTHTHWKSCVKITNTQ